MSVADLLGGLAGLSVALTLWQWWAARRFPLHQRAADPAFAPGVTVLKPLKGCDAETAACLRSWLAQEYPGPLQVLFGVASADDPACPLVRALLAEFPQRQAALLICPETLGANRKVSKLAQLQPHAAHEIIVVADADVRVPPDLLIHAVAPLRDAGVGLVCCLYRLANPTTPALRWEAVAINADFWSQVLQARTLKPLDFALGAVMVTRRTQLEALGGWAALADYLADDYQLGRRIARAGGRIEICPVVVDCWSAPLGWRAVWRHQLRWARTIRVCQPWPYFFSILSNATWWPLLWVLTNPRLLVWAAAGLAWGLRIGVAIGLQHRLHPGSGAGRWFWLVPVKDLLQVALWAAALVGNDIHWQGENYRLRRDGRMVPEPATARGVSPNQP